MEIKRIEGATRTLGAPHEWDHGKCHGLPILDGMHDGVPVMVSAWEPSPLELEALLRGETIKLWIYGATHPVVSMTVGEVCRV